VTTLAVDGAELFYEQTGAGPDIVWLAAGDHPGANWRASRRRVRARLPQHDLRRARRRLDDLRGGPRRGRSGEHARDCAALIEAACAPPVFLVGLSMGSLIATQLACTRPDLVRAALVMGTCVRKTGFIREWEEAEIALHANGAVCPATSRPPTTRLLYYPAEVLGDDELWARIRPLVAADFAAATARMLAPSGRRAWTTTRRDSCRGARCRSTRSRSRTTSRRRRRAVREVADLARHGRFHLLEGLGHGSAFGHRPDVVNACLRAILDEHLARPCGADAAHDAPLPDVRDRVDGEAEALEERGRAGVAGVVLDTDLGRPGGLADALEQRGRRCRGPAPRARRRASRSRVRTASTRSDSATPTGTPSSNATSIRPDPAAAERVLVEELLDRPRRPRVGQQALVRRPPRRGPRARAAPGRPVRSRADRITPAAGHSSRLASSRLRTLPVALRGSSSRNTTSRGTL
jgi:pimeloyl-ACP methyl ester carboxylesterase